MPRNADIGDWSPERLLIVIGALTAFAFGACSPPDDQACSPTCQSTFTCNESKGICEPKRLTVFHDEVPGRRLVSTVYKQAPFIAAVEPENRLVVAGRPDGTDAISVLDKLDGEQRLGVAIDATDDRVVVGWPADDGLYRVAVRREGRWHLTDSISPLEGRYRASRHFDVAAEEDGGVHIVFRNRLNGDLQHLSRGDSEWSLLTIDNGSAVGGRSQCPSGIGDPMRSGVGYDPDAEAASDRLYVSYYDADCGDLRLGKRTGDDWLVSVVDTGDFSLGTEGVKESGNVGRFSSLVVGSSGTVSIAYQDVRRGRLLYARRSAEEFTVQLVDPGMQLDENSQKRKQLVGAFSALSFKQTESQQVPYIAYMNGSENRLRVTYRLELEGNNGRWIHRTLDVEPPAGFFATIEASAESDVIVMSEQLEPSANGVDSRLVTRRLGGP
mgnify:CR=1 FL=1